MKKIKHAEKQSNAVCNNTAYGNSGFHGYDNADEPITSVTGKGGDGKLRWRIFRAATTRGCQHAIIGEVASEPSVSPNKELGYLYLVSMGVEDIGFRVLNQHLRKYMSHALHK